MPLCSYDLISNDARAHANDQVIGWWSTLIAQALGMLPETHKCQVTAFTALYLRFMMWTVTESIIKLTIQKARPAHYHKTSSHVGITLKELQKAAAGEGPAAAAVAGVMIPGDQYAFPSGHTLRAFATARVMVTDPVLSSAFGTAAIFGPPWGFGAIGLLAVASVAGWARIALGKHSITDVIAGAALGVFMADIFEPAVGPEGRWLYQQFALSYFTLIGLIAALDLTRESDRDDTLGLRGALGFLDSENQKAFIFGPMVGSWIYVLCSTSCDGAY